MTEPNNSLLIWLDLETTGLNPREGEVLEIAAFASDLQGTIVSRMETQIINLDRKFLLPLMDDYVLEMHLKNGLLKAVWGREPKNMERTSTWDRVDRWLSRLPGDPKNRYLAGNSIHFDRSWIKEHAPKVLERVSHRMLDISSFLLVRPDWRSGVEPAHRALEDAQQSHRTYVEKILPALLPGFSQTELDEFNEIMDMIDPLGQG